MRRVVLSLLLSSLMAGSMISLSAPSASAAAPSVASAARISHAYAWAKTRKGMPYRYGASGPRAFDCSGLVRWAYAHVGRHLPRTSSAQAARSRRISARSARPGDLVFFYSGRHVYHAALYAGHHRVFHASRPGKPIGFERIWTSHVFYARAV